MRPTCTHARPDPRVVSFDRPYGYGNGAGTYLSLVYPLTRLAEEEGLDVTYWTDLTLATGPHH